MYPFTASFLLELSGLLQVSISNYHFYLEYWVTYWNLTNRCNNFCVCFSLILIFYKFIIFYSEQWVLHCVNWKSDNWMIKRSNRRCSIKQAVLKYFAMFTGKHLRWSLKYIKKRLQHRCFPVNIAKVWRAPILKNGCSWMMETVYLELKVENLL